MDSCNTPDVRRTQASLGMLMCSARAVVARAIVRVCRFNEGRPVQRTGDLRHEVQPEIDGAVDERSQVGSDVLPSLPSSPRASLT